MHTIILFLIFFFSGAAALIYEGSWNRQIGLYLGNTTQSSSIVLGSFFLGMGIGYRIGNLWPKGKSPLVGYGLVEILAAISAVAFPSVLHFVMNFSADTIPTSDSGQHYVSLAKNSLLVFTCLLPSTIALGATLPLMARIVKQFFGQKEDGSKITLAYGINTIGAIFGLLSCSYFLFLLAGVQGSSKVAAAISICCGLAAFSLAAAKKPASLPREDSPVGSNKVPTAALIAASISGFVSLGLEVLYLRLFSLVFHNSTYTFGLILTVFLFALACASIATSRIPTRRLYQAFMFAVTAAPILVMLSVFLMIYLTNLNYFDVGSTFAHYILAAFALTFGIVFPPIFLCGLILPITWRILINDKIDEASVVSRCTMWNSVLAAVGAISTNFLLLSTFGLFTSFAILGAVLYLLSFQQISATIPKKSTVWQYGFLSAFVLASAFLVPHIHNKTISAQYPNKRLINRWNSAYGWIDLLEDQSENYQIHQNIHYRHGSTGSSKKRQKRQALIPLLVHPNPNDTLFLGLGTGGTASGASDVSSTHSIDIVELIPEVVQAVKFLEPSNNQVLSDHRTQVYCDDARHFLNTNTKKYDVVVADLFVPWESQTGYLYTSEHYKAIDQRLKAGGIFFQCLPVYQIGQSQMTTILDTMKKEFQHVSLWWISLSPTKPMIGVMASQKPISLEQFQVATNRNGLTSGQWTSDVYLSNLANFRSCYIGDWELSGQEIYNTDEYPVIEFTTPIDFGNYRLLSGKVFVEYYKNHLYKLKYSGAVNSVSKDRFGDMKDIHLLMLQDNRSWN